MPIKLYTGLPGAGKTLALVEEIHRIIDNEPGRPLFVLGINGLKEGLGTPLEDVTRWDALPPGSIIAIDECQELMPTDRGNTPDWIRRLSKVRHHGIDFLLTTQHPNLISNYVRRLVDHHVHHVRKFNTTLVQRFTWNRCMDNPEKRSEQRSAEVGMWTFPSKHFGDYKSAQLHTMKRRIPFRAWLFLGLLIGGPIFVGLAIYTIKHIPDRSVADSKKSPAASSSSSTTTTDKVQLTQDAMLRHDNYAKWITPRVSGLPWTAPAFDHLEVRAQPRLYCIAAEDGRCSCITEQGTKYEVPLTMCRRIARDGVYDPFLAPDRLAQDQVASKSAQAASQPSPTSQTDAGIDDGYKERATAIAYQPPDLQVPEAMSSHGIKWGH